MLIKNALKKLNKRLTELNRLLQAVLKKSVLSGESSELFKGYARSYEVEKQELAKRAEQLVISNEKQSQIETDVEIFISPMKKYVNIIELDW